MANPNYSPAYKQYTQQSAGYVLPSSVRTYSVFDPASNSWRRMTNDGMSPMPQGNQPDIQAALAQARETRGTVYLAQGMGQGQPIEVHPGYLNPPVQAARGQNQRTPTNPVGTSKDLGYGVTAQTVGNYDYSKAHGNENPVAPLTQPGVVYPPARNLAGYDPNNPPVIVNQAAVDPMFTPEFNQRAINMSEGTTAKAINNARWYGDQFLRMAESIPTTAPLGTVAELPNFGRIGQNALNTARRIIPSLDDVSAYASGLVERIPAGVRSAYDSVVDLGRGLFNRAGGFLQKPVPTATVQPYTKVRPTHTMVNPNARRSANYYGH